MMVAPPLQLLEEHAQRPVQAVEQFQCAYPLKDLTYVFLSWDNLANLQNCEV